MGKYGPIWAQVSPHSTISCSDKSKNHSPHRYNALHSSGLPQTESCHTTGKNHTRKRVLSTVHCNCNCNCNTVYVRNTGRCNCNCHTVYVRALPIGIAYKITEKLYSSRILGLFLGCLGIILNFGA